MKKHIFDATINHLWQHRFYYYDDHLFDFPFYGGIPRKINRTFSSEAVDAMQNVWEEFTNDFYKTKKQFASAYKVELKILGENVEK